MRRLLAGTTAGILSGLWLLNAGTTPGKGLPANPLAPAKVCTTESCGGDYGTSVKFEDTPSLAARKALKEEKLVMVLHISGLFENPEFT